MKKFRISIEVDIDARTEAFAKAEAAEILDSMRYWFSDEPDYRVVGVSQVLELPPKAER